MYRGGERRVQAEGFSRRAENKTGTKRERSPEHEAGALARDRSEGDRREYPEAPEAERPVRGGSAELFRF